MVGKLVSHSILVDIRPTLIATSDLVGDMLLGGDDLVHVCSYGGLQGGAGRLTLLQQRLILGLALPLHQAVYHIADLYTGNTHMKAEPHVLFSFSV